MENQLQDRVVLIAGPLTTTVQSLMTGLTEQGADVALLDDEAQKADKFCAQLMDQREVKSKYGRAICMKADLSNPLVIKESVGKIAQSLGGIDVFIDAQIHQTPSAFHIDQQLDAESDHKLNDYFQKNLKSTLFLTQTVAGYLKSRKKGRIIYLMNGGVFRNIPQDIFHNAFRSSLITFTQNLSHQLQEHKVTANILSLGVTEEYLLSHYSGMNIKDALQEYRKYDFSARITEPDKITNSIIYLSGPSGLAITGQVIHLT